MRHSYDCKYYNVSVILSGNLSKSLLKLIWIQKPKGNLFYTVNISSRKIAYVYVFKG